MIHRRAHRRRVWSCSTRSSDGRSSCRHWAPWRTDPGQCHFWATHGGAEIGLFVERHRPRRRPEWLGFELERTTAPTVTRSMRHALEDLQLTELLIVHAGTETFPLGRRIRVVAAARLLEDLA